MEYLISLFVMLIEYLSLINIGQAFLFPRGKNKIVFFGVIHILISFVALNFIFRDNNIFKFAIIYLIMLAVYIVCFEGQLVTKIFSAFIYSIVLYSTDYIILLILSIMLGISFEMVVGNTIAYMIVAVVSKFALFFITYMIKLFYRRNDRNLSINKQYLLYAVAFPLVSFATIILLIDLTTSYNITSIWVTITVLGIIAANIILLSLLDFLEEERREKQDNLILQQQLKVESNSFEIVKELYEKQRRLTHDFNNHLIAIHSMAERAKNDRIVKYVSELAKDTTTDVLINSNNISVDAILNQKYTKATSQGISMRFEINDLSGIKIVDSDMVTILSNALDNALEASSKTVEKFIKVKIMDNNEEMIITVMNTSNPVRIINNHVITTKKDNVLHGYGLKNIKSTVNKYNGTCAISYNKGWFQLSIIIDK